MQRYNINALSYLIGLFKKTCAEMGENAKTVQYFRDIVNGLVNINQLSYNDVDTVYSIIGMKNTNAVKWDKSKEKIDNFINLMQIMESCSTQEERIYRLALQQGVNDEVKRIVQDIYNLEIKKDFQVTSKFGVMESQPIMVTSRLKHRSLEEFIKRYGDLTIKVQNLDAVCCSDRSYYTYLVRNIEQHDVVIKLIKRGASFSIGHAMSVGDPWHPTTTIKNIDEVHDELLQIIKEMR